MTQATTTPAQPFLKWAGGKRELLPKLLQAVAAAKPFGRYFEPFLGGGALFFALARASELRSGAILSDVNPNLMEAYQGVRDEIDGVIDVLEQHQAQHSEAYYYALRALIPTTLAARAARIIYLNRTGFNGLYRENKRGIFNVPIGRHRHQRICNETRLRAAAATLANAELRAADYTQCLVDARPADLVYLDPPYAPVSSSAYFTAYAKQGFGPADQQQLAATFSELAARGVHVILSNSDTSFIRELYRSHCCYVVEASRSVNSRTDRRGKVPELLITSFPLHTGRDAASRAWREARVLPPKADRTGVKTWLRQHGYAEVATTIETLTADWQAQGKATRRNWWDILAGDRHGRPRTVDGHSFPVIAAAQVRQGREPTPNADHRGLDDAATPSNQS